MAEIRIESGLHEPLGNANGMDANYWSACAYIDGSPHTDAAGPTLDLALLALATKLAIDIENRDG